MAPSVKADEAMLRPALPLAPRTQYVPVHASCIVSLLLLLLLLPAICGRVSEVRVPCASRCASVRLLLVLLLWDLPVSVLLLLLVSESNHAADACLKPQTHSSERSSKTYNDHTEQNRKGIPSHSDHDARDRGNATGCINATQPQLERSSSIIRERHGTALSPLCRTLAGTPTPKVP